jgi:hypothetical protein
MSTPSVSINPYMQQQFAILPTTLIVKPVYELIAKMPGYYGINPTMIVLTAINSLSIINPAVLEYHLHEFMKDVQATAAGNLTKLDPAHEQELAKAIIVLWHSLTNLFTQLQLWSDNGTSFWKFYSFTNYDIIMRYTGAREDELRVSSGPGGPIPNSVH